MSLPAQQQNRKISSLLKNAENFVVTRTHEQIDTQRVFVCLAKPACMGVDTTPEQPGAGSFRAPTIFRSKQKVPRASRKHRKTTTKPNCQRAPSLVASRIRTEGTDWAKKRAVVCLSALQRAKLVAEFDKTPVIAEQEHPLIGGGQIRGRRLTAAFAGIRLV